MAAVADTVANAATADPQGSEPARAAFVRELLMGQDPEAYAQACEALAAATNPGLTPSGPRSCSLTGTRTKSAPRPPTSLAAELGSAESWSSRGPATGQCPRRRTSSPPPSSSSSPAQPSRRRQRRPARAATPARAASPAASRASPCRSARPPNNRSTAPSQDKDHEVLSKTLFPNVNILDSTGAEPFLGEVLVDDDRIAAVRAVIRKPAPEGVRVIDGRGQTLMSGLCDAHTHFTWNNSADLNGLGTMRRRGEHLLYAVAVRQNLHRLRLHHVLGRGRGQEPPRRRRAATPSTPGSIPGPRYLANGQEIAVTGGALVKGITAYRRRRRGDAQSRPRDVELGVDQIKLSHVRRRDHRQPARRRTPTSPTRNPAAVDRGPPPRQAGLHPRPQPANPSRCAWQPASTSSTTPPSSTTKAWTCSKPTRTGCSSPRHQLARRHPQRRRCLRLLP